MRPKEPTLDRRISRSHERTRQVEFRQGASGSEVPADWTALLSNEPEPLLAWIRRGGWTTAGTHQEWFAAWGPIAQFLWTRESTGGGTAAFNREIANLRRAVGLLPTSGELPAQGRIDLGTLGTYTSEPDRGRPVPGLLRTRVGGSTQDGQSVGKLFSNLVPFDTGTNDFCGGPSGRAPHDQLTYTGPGWNPTVTGFVSCGGPVGPAVWAKDTPWFIAANGRSSVFRDFCAGCLTPWDKGQWLIGGDWQPSVGLTPDCGDVYSTNLCAGGCAGTKSYCTGCTGCSCTDPCCEVPRVVGSTVDGSGNQIGCTPCCTIPGCVGNPAHPSYPVCCNCPLQSCSCIDSVTKSMGLYHGCRWPSVSMRSTGGPTYGDACCSGLGTVSVAESNGYEALDVIWYNAEGGGDGDHCGDCSGCLPTDHYPTGITDGWVRTIPEDRLQPYGYIRDTVPADRTARNSTAITATDWDADSYIVNPPGPFPGISWFLSCGIFAGSGVSLCEYHGGPPWWQFRRRLMAEIATGRYPNVRAFFETGVADAVATLALADDEDGWKRVPLKAPWWGDAWYRRQGSVVEWKGTLRCEQAVSGGVSNATMLPLIPEEAMPLVNPWQTVFTFSGYPLWKVQLQCPRGVCWANFVIAQQSATQNDLEDSPNDNTQVNPNPEHRSGQLRIDLAGPYQDTTVFPAVDVNGETTSPGGPYEEVTLDGLTYTGADFPIPDETNPPKLGSDQWISEITPGGAYVWS